MTDLAISQDPEFNLLLMRILDLLMLDEESGSHRNMDTIMAVIGRLWEMKIEKDHNFRHLYN